MPRKTLKTRQPTAGRVARVKRAQKKTGLLKTKTPNEKKPTHRLAGANDPLSQYFRDLGRAPGLLMPEEELHAGKEVREATTAAAKALCTKLREDARLLAGISRPCVAEAELERLHQEASRRRRRFNPLGLDGRALDGHILEIAGTNEALDLIKTYGPPGSSAVTDGFIEANLRLVVNVARRFHREGGHLQLNDLIQEGNLGLILGALRYDYTRGLRFSTYASWWIRHAISRALFDKAREIRIPVHLQEMIQTAEKASRDLTATLGRKATIEEIARKILRDGRGLQRLGKSEEAPSRKEAELIKKLYKCEVYMLAAVSFNAPTNRDPDSQELGETILVEEEEAPPWKAVDGPLLRNAMRNLSPIEQDVLRQRFGFGDDEERTFKQVAEKYGLSRERIRQVQNAALDKIKKQLERHVRAAT